jgi:rhamnose transport system permease protein
VSVLRRHRRELAAAAAWAALLALVAAAAPGFFSAANLRDLALDNAPVLVVAVGMTLVVLAGEIDISVGSQFAVCGVAVGLLARAGAPAALLARPPVLVGGALGAVNGLLVGRLRLPSIIVTLALLVAWRDALRWATEGRGCRGCRPTSSGSGSGSAPDRR